MLISALIDSGATRLFIDIDYVQSKIYAPNISPETFPVYNMDGTLHEAGYITKVVDLIVKYGDHLKRATFHVTGISQTTIVLSHTWLVEHNPEIDWCTGKVSLTRCPLSCRPKATADLNDQPIPRSAGNLSEPPQSQVMTEGAH